MQERADHRRAVAEHVEASLGARHKSEQQVRQFVADASHELRTPLTSILANLELLDDGLADGDEDERAAISSAVRSSKRMNRLVGDLLLLARADAGRATMRRESTGRSARSPDAVASPKRRRMISLTTSSA